MSNSKTGKGKFGFMAGALAAEHKLTETEQASPPAPATKNENPLETLSSQMRKQLKKALKQASATEERASYLILEQALEEYLKANHKDLKF